MPDILTLDRLPPETRKAVADPLYGARVMCPKCDGGSTRERSLSIRSVDNNDGMLKLSCWRGTCGYWAYVLLDGTFEWQGKQMREPSVYRDEILPCTPEQLEILVRDYGLDAELLGKRGWASTPDGALLIPIRGVYGSEMGHITRTLDKKKRVYTYKATAQSFLDVWYAHPDKPWVIVEDCLSAARLIPCGLNAVALLGTNISSRDAKALAEITSGRAYLALDNDAWDKSLKWANRHAHVLTMLPVPLNLDIKNMESDDDIKKLFGA